jgi:hypothetical protein
VPAFAPALAASATASAALVNVPRAVYLLALLEAMLLTTSRVPVAS